MLGAALVYNAPSGYDGLAMTKTDKANFAKDLAEWLEEPLKKIDFASVLKDISYQITSDLTLGMVQDKIFLETPNHMPPLQIISLGQLLSEFEEERNAADDAEELLKVAEILEKHAAILRAKAGNSGK